MKNNVRNREFRNLYHRINDGLLLSDRLTSSLKVYIESSENLAENSLEFARFINEAVQIASSNLKYTYFNELKNLEVQSQELDNQTNIDSVLRRQKNRIFEVYSLLASLSKYLNFVQTGIVPNIRFGLIQQFDYLCQALISDSKLIAISNYYHNFSYYPIKQDILESVKVKSKIGLAFDDLFSNSPFYFSLAFPQHLSDNLLGLGIWGHEIGHLIDNYLGLQENGDYPYISAERAKDIQIKIPDDIIQSVLDKIKNKSDQDEYSKRWVIGRIARFIRNWAIEVFADVVSIRLFGPAALLAMSEFLEPMSDGMDSIRNPSYPSYRTRLHILMRQYEILFENTIENMKNQFEKTVFEKYLEEIDYLKSLEQTTIEGPFYSMGIPTSDRIIMDNIYPSINIYIDQLLDVFNKDIEAFVNTNYTKFFSGDDFKIVFDYVEDLKHNLPPRVSDKKTSDDSTYKTIPIILNAGWVFWIANKSITDNLNLEAYEEKRMLFGNLNSLLFKSIDNYDAKIWFDRKKKFGKEHFSYQKSSSINQSKIDSEIFHKAGFLSGNEIIHLIKNKELIMTPILDQESQIGSSSIDFRLGNEFITTRRARLTRIDPMELEIDTMASDYLAKTYIPFGKPFVLHQGQFALASSLEYLSLSDEYIGLVLNRPKWARLGLVIPTSFKIPPGYQGTITLEMSNMGNAPILLYPGSRIGQVVLASMRYEDATSTA